MKRFSICLSELQQHSQYNYVAMSYRSVLVYSTQNGSGAKQASHQMGTGTSFPTGNEDSAEVGMCEANLCSLLCLPSIITNNFIFYQVPLPPLTFKVEGE